MPHGVSVAGTPVGTAMPVIGAVHVMAPAVAAPVPTNDHRYLSQLEIKMTLRRSTQDTPTCNSANTSHLGSRNAHKHSRPW